MFQSTPRVRGERSDCAMLITDNEVSIHAPRAGRKRVFAEDIFHGLCFNPRPACGAKVASTYILCYVAMFQSTPRVRGESCVDLHSLLCGEVSIHAPRAGRKKKHLRSSRSTLCFNTRPACGAKGQRLMYGRCGSVVSIHAPRAGRKLSSARP